MTESPMLDCVRSGYGLGVTRALHLEDESCSRFRGRLRRLHNLAMTPQSDLPWEKIYLEACGTNHLSSLI